MITKRRLLLDGYLSNSVFLMQGDVIDIGGKKENKRGSFKPPLAQVNSWKYLNNDKSTNPDYLCGADHMPIDDNSFDTALLCEVIEHLENPEQALTETYRILKDGGSFIISSPFLFPVHADPYDYQRWTDTKLYSKLVSIGFREITIRKMGGVGAVIHDLLLVSIKKKQHRFSRSTGFIGFYILKPFLTLFDKIFDPLDKSITSGYFVTCRKYSSTKDF